METRAGDPGAFARFDLSRVDSPAFVVDLAKLRSNLQILADVRDAAEITVLAALKAFSMSSVAPVTVDPSDHIEKALSAASTRAPDASPIWRSTDRLARTFAASTTKAGEGTRVRSKWAKAPGSPALVSMAAI